MAGRRRLPPPGTRCRRSRSGWEASVIIIAVLALLALAALLPLAGVLRRGPPVQGRRDAAIALHRAQLDEVERDLTEGRISIVDRDAARLEVQRRLLAAADLPDAAPARDGRWVVVGALVVVPLVAAGLYAIGGHPTMPAMPLAARGDVADRQSAEEARLIEVLRQRLSELDPHSDQARQGYVLLGNVEDGRGNLTAAAEAWRRAVGMKFDPMLAAQAAEAQTRVEGRVSADSAALFRQALASAPPDAPWRPLAEQRLKEVN